jgi:hypothetical protein
MTGIKPQDRLLDKPLVISVTADPARNWVRFRSFRVAGRYPSSGPIIGRANRHIHHSQPWLKLGSFSQFSRRPSGSVPPMPCPPSPGADQDQRQSRSCFECDPAIRMYQTKASHIEYNALFVATWLQNPAFSRRFDRHDRRSLPLRHDPPDSDRIRDRGDRTY